MIFTYWQQADAAPIAETLEHWRARYPDFQVLGDADIEPLFARHLPERLHTYRALRLPTAKSDVARTIALYEHGGLYVDCHCAIRDKAGIDALLDAHELCVINRHSPGHLVAPFSSIVFALERSGAAFAVLRHAMDRLAAKQAQERESGFAPYSIWSLCGPGNWAEVLADPAGERKALRESFRGRVHLIFDHRSPIERNKFRFYRGVEAHWSVREKTELLFA